MSYEIIILWSWAVLMFVWVVGSFGVKRDIRSGSVSSKVLAYRYLFLQVIGIVLVVFTLWHVVTGRDDSTKAVAAIFSNGTFTPPLALNWIAAILVVLGILFAIWARINLGRNWSSTPSIKENHKLVTSGPYRFVRHPIYTGILLAAFGTALTGTSFGIILFLIALIIFSLRIPKEEKIMLELFPNEYPSYQRRTKRLIPFVW
jgi:protein-S-isoprenylcysteine O-methyltransferase